MLPDLMKGEIDEHSKLREPLVRLPGEPDHWTFYLKICDRICYDYSRRSARRRRVIARGREAAAKRVAPRYPITGVVGCWACATTGHATDEPAIALIKSRRRIAFPKA